MEFLKLRGTLFGDPYNKDPTVQDTILGSPVFGNSQIQNHTSCQLYCPHEVFNQTPQSRLWEYRVWGYIILQLQNPILIIKGPYIMVIVGLEELEEGYGA